MAYTLLRSGDLDSVLPLGENGQPVWLSALQIRETLRLRQQQALVDLLAIPQVNEAGNRLVWYAPFAGKIVSWNSASEADRARALDQIERDATALRGISEKALASSKAAHRLSGALLSRVLQFPDQNYVYLVGGKPVITFWGFVSLNKKTGNALELLRASVHKEIPPDLSRPASVAVNQAAALPCQLAPDLSLPASSAEPCVPLNPPPAEQPLLVYERPLAKRYSEAQVTASLADERQLPPAASAAPDRTFYRYAWLVPGAALIALLGFQLRGGISEKQPEPPARQSVLPEAVTTQPATAPIKASPANTDSELEKAPPSTSNVPTDVQQAVSVQQPAPEPVAEPAPPTAEPVQPDPASAQQATAEPATAVPLEKGSLVLPGIAVRLGSTTFLNGVWLAVPDSRQPLTDKPPALHYQLNNGKGSVHLIQGNGATCRGDAYAGLMKSGNLVINARTRAKCSDGTRFTLPEVTCSQESTGPAQCTVRYDENMTYPVTFTRKGK